MENALRPFRIDLRFYIEAEDIHEAIEAAKEGRVKPFAVTAMPTDVDQYQAIREAIASQDKDTL